VSVFSCPHVRASGSGVSAFAQPDVGAEIDERDRESGFAQDRDVAYRLAHSTDSVSSTATPRTVASSELSRWRQPSTAARSSAPVASCAAARMKNRLGDANERRGRKGGAAESSSSAESIGRRTAGGRQSVRFLARNRGVDAAVWE